MKPCWSLDQVVWGPLHGPGILDNIHLDLAAGRLIGLLGPNGSGKTCLLNLLAGQARPRSGTVSFGGEPTAPWREPQWARSVAHLAAQRDATVTLAVEEVLLAAQFSKEGQWPKVGSRPSDEALALLDEWELLGKRKRADFLEQTFASLSDGERQLVSLIRVLTQGAPSVVLDEPLAFLDVRHRLLVQRTLVRLASRGATIILSLHELETDLEWIDEVLVMSQGAVVAQGVPRVVLTNSLMEQVWGVRWEAREGLRRPVLM